MFAYCLNNPVKMIDSIGNMAMVRNINLIMTDAEGVTGGDGVVVIGGSGGGGEILLFACIVVVYYATVKQILGSSIFHLKR